jgi:hypothetical protein
VVVFGRVACELERQLLESTTRLSRLCPENFHDSLALADMSTFVNGGASVHHNLVSDVAAFVRSNRSPILPVLATQLLTEVSFIVVCT